MRFWWYQHLVKVDELGVFQCTACHRLHGGNGDKDAWSRRHDRVHVDGDGPRGAWCVGVWQKLEVTDAHRAAYKIGGGEALSSMLLGDTQPLDLPQPLQVQIGKAPKGGWRRGRPEKDCEHPSDRAPLELCYALRDDGLWIPDDGEEHIAFCGQDRRGFPIAMAQEDPRGGFWNATPLRLAMDLTSLRFSCANGRYWKRP